MAANYGFQAHIPNSAVDQAVERVTKALKDEGFGVLTRIDVKDTLKVKLGVEFRPYVILGACNPQLAHRALSADPQIGLLLPCNAVVQAAGDGVDVSIADPAIMFSIVDQPALKAIADEAAERLQRVMQSLQD